MKELSVIAKQITPSATLRVDALYKQMKADGLDVIGFGAGEPDFVTPDNICAAAKKAIDEGRTGYTPAAGIPALRHAIADRLRSDYGLNYDYTQIVTAAGAKHNIYIALQVLLNPGDEVILPAPYWVSYLQIIRMAGGNAAVLPTSDTGDFKISAQQLEAAINDKTKLLILCNPSNPTGMLYTKSELEQLMEVCKKHDIYILADEIYAKLVYDGKTFTSAASLSEDACDRTILISGLSKAYAMTGWRVGYSASNPVIAKAMENYVSHSTSATSTISQYAALEALNGPQESIVKMRETFEKRRDYIVAQVNSIEGINCRKPDGAFYIMINIAEQIGRELGGRLIMSSDDFALALLEAAKVATVSCTDFGIDNYIRLTYAASMETITEGMDRIKTLLYSAKKYA